MGVKNGLRRGAALAIALITTGALVTACGSSDDSANSTTKATAENPVGCQTDGQTGNRVIKDTFYGDVTIPAQPKRIVSGWLLGTQFIDLNVRPVGMLDDYKKNATTEELSEVQGIPDVGSIQTGFNAEEVISLKPDVIITAVRPDMVEDLHMDQLKEIAPVVAFPIQEPTDVWSVYPKLAAALGCGDSAQKQLDQLNTDLGQIATDNKDAEAKLGSVAYVEGSEQPATYQIATNKSLSYDRITKAGLKYFDGVPADPKRYVELVSTEDIARLSSANVLFFEADENGKPTKRTQALLDQEAFKNLPAVKAGNLFPYRLPYAYTVGAAKDQIDDIKAAVEKAKPAQ
ncbi:MAG: ABC transporter substrate-binding protein [Gordonia sp. (in: high G+C Gram-positive bacteria)]|uniref:ABC transporter substrate-binding protein n=1 Tax=Gordonia sp. (in: high G+C Gram-positive bacteria) TaxID=84139 RepID=UPI0039E5FD95